MKEHRSRYDQRQDAASIGAPAMNKPRCENVAVIITCYNEGPFIGAAVTSVLKQSAADAIGDIIIADDGSDDDTLAVLRDIEKWDRRIRVIYGPGGNRQAAQRNMAVLATDLALIAFLDGDDLWVPGKLAAQLEACRSDPSVGLVYTAFSNFSNEDPSKARPAKLVDITAEQDLALAYFLNDPPILPSTVLMSRELYVASGGMDEAIHCFEETEFYLRIARQTRFACLKTPFVYKRNRPGSITGGRKDLLAFHAFVALKAAASNADLLGRVPVRLAERARKLANQHFLAGEAQQARSISAFAVRLMPWKARNWLTWLLARLPVAAASLLQRTAFASRVEVSGKDTSSK